MSRDLGDWQTPKELSRAVFEVLIDRGVKWSRVLEPTCGSGSFVVSALQADLVPSEIIGIDIQDEHLATARVVVGTCDTAVQLIQGDIFQTDLRDLHWQSNGPLLVVGNPPWVTNAELGTLGSSNLPVKSNLKRLNGLDAITGSANFDIAEFITLKLMGELMDQEPTIALLVKTAVARNVLRYSRSVDWKIARASIHHIDAKDHFGADVDACLLVAECGGDEVIQNIPVYPSLTASEPLQVMGFSNGDLVADVHSYRQAGRADGACMLTWRQGLKHDAASVMELDEGDDMKLRNKLGQVVDVEPEYVYPLIKGTQIFRGDTVSTTKWVVVPQQRIEEDTRHLEHLAPRLWAYLSDYRSVLDGRRSSIYRGKPPFVVFGVGNYTFTDYKVAISGLHKEPRFRLVGPIQERPVILDDTSYLLPCVDAEQAALLVATLTSRMVTQLLKALMFSDSKRPVTKKLLQRIDLLSVLEIDDLSDILARADAHLDRLGISAPLPRDPSEVAAIVSAQPMMSGARAPTLW